MHGRPAPASRPGRCGAPRHRSLRLFGRGLLGDSLIVLLCVLPLGLCYFWPALIWAFIVFTLPAVLFWVLIFGRFKTSTEIRRGLRDMREGR